MTDEQTDTTDILLCRCADCAAPDSGDCTSRQVRRVITGIFSDGGARTETTGLFCRHGRKIAVTGEPDCRCPDCALNPDDRRVCCR